jgi:hypothetical protein
MPQKYNIFCYNQNYFKFFCILSGKTDYLQPCRDIVPAWLQNISAISTYKISIPDFALTGH